MWVCVCPCDRLATCSGCTLPSPNSNWVDSSKPVTPKGIQRVLEVDGEKHHNSGDGATYKNSIKGSKTRLTKVKQEVKLADTLNTKPQKIVKDAQVKTMTNYIFGSCI